MEDNLITAFQGSKWNPSENGLVRLSAKTVKEGNVLLLCSGYYT
jgi:hypothetical protein